MPSRAFGLVAALLLLAVPVAAQEGAPANGTLRVFLDCQSLHCDFDYLRREITLVDWVRDRAVAEVHVLGTGREAGVGGREITFIFIGQRGFRGRTDTLRYTTGPTDTDQERRAALGAALQLGLVPFIARTPLRRRVQFVYVADSSTAPAVPADDPWNFWVFRVSGGGSMEGESREQSLNLRGSLDVTRVTEAQKFEFRVNGRYSRDEFELDSVTTFISTQTNWGAQVANVWSAGPHWGIAALAEVDHSTFRNYDVAIEGGVGVEFSVFPYEQSSSRRITLQYAAGGTYNRYLETTVFGRDAETRPVHQADVSVGFQQPWGNLFGGLSARQYLDDLDRHRVELHGGFSLRLIRGLNLNVFGNVARVKDQINLAAGDLTPEEIIVRQRQLGTDFRYQTNVSLSYTFGSIFNNVVNPRF